MVTLDTPLPSKSTKTLPPTIRASVLPIRIERFARSAKLVLICRLSGSPVTVPTVVPTQWGWRKTPSPQRR
jgi:hypothetical protein